MRVFVHAGKALVLLFWLLVLANLVDPFTRPFDGLLNVCGGVMLLLHVAELLVFGERLKVSGNLARERVLVLLFGVLQLISLPDPEPAMQAEEAAVSEPPVTPGEEVSHA